MTKPPVSIIIPAWNEKSVLLDCLNSLKRLDYTLDTCELIIVAGGTDSTPQLCKEQTMDGFGKYIVLEQSPGDGRVGAIIKGIKKSKKAIVIILDADTIVDKHWLRNLVKRLIEGNFDAVNGTAHPIRGRHLFSAFYSIEQIKVDFDNHPRLSGAAGIAIRRSVFSEYGVDNFFNKNITFYDYYLFKRLQSRGYKIGVAKEAVDYTYYSSTVQAFLSDQIKREMDFFDILKKENLRVQRRLFKSIGVIFSFLISLISLFIGFKNILIPFYLIFLFFILKVSSRIVPSLKKDFTYIFYYPLYVLSHLMIHTVIIYAAISQFLGISKIKDLHYKGERPKQW